jgi:hypothetical protein
MPIFTKILQEPKKADIWTDGDEVPFGFFVAEGVRVKDTFSIIGTPASTIYSRRGTIITIYGNSPDTTLTHYIANDSIQFLNVKVPKEVHLSVKL